MRKASALPGKSSLLGGSKGRPLGLRRVRWRSKEGTDPSEGKGEEGVVWSRWASFLGWPTGRLWPCKVCLQAQVSMDQGQVKAVEPWALPPCSPGSPRALVHKGAAGSTAGPGDTRCAGDRGSAGDAGGTGVGDTGPNGLVACVGGGAGVAGEPGEKE